ncbi:MAG: hypothetical protein GX437_00010 [Sphingobacteriales bacterium]|nr:hypothetical protein [Sphingobacteriales bacterium]
MKNNQKKVLRIPLEEKLGLEIYDILEGELIEEILKKSQVEKNETG